MKLVDKTIIQDIKPQIIGIILVILLVLLTVGLEALSPWPYKYLIDNLLENHTIEPTNFFNSFLLSLESKAKMGAFVVGLFFLVNVLLSITEYFRQNTQKRLIRKIIFQFSQSAFHNLLKLNLGFYNDQRIGDYIYRLSYDTEAVGVLIEEGLLPIITSSLFLITTAIIMFVINIKLTLVSLVVLPFLAASLYFMNKRMVEVSRESERLNSTFFSFIQQSLNQLKIIQAYQQEKKETGEFNDKLRNSLLCDFHLNHLNFLLSLIVGIIIAISYSFIIGFGINAVFAGEITAGLLIVFIFYLDNLTNPILSIIYAVSTLRESYVRVSRLGEFFEKKNLTDLGGSINSLPSTDIVYQKVNMFSNDGVHILKDLNLHIYQGKINVIIGASGSGKTSTISLLLRLVNDPQQGIITLGGKSLQEYDLEFLRANIGFLPQDNTLFNNSVFNVIAFGKPDATLEEVKHAAELALANDFIEKLPGGYDFRVGEGGNYLSGGQRQRLALARVFIKNAPILVLDEPLSFLDLKTRKAIWENIKFCAKDKTAIIVSNLLDIIEDASNVIILDNGTCVAEDTTANLIKHKKLASVVIKEG